MSSNLVIHNNNVPFLDDFDYKIIFKVTGVDVDRYITDTIMPQIVNIDCKVIYIKDNLSSNYLELYGIRLAYHIRLSQIVLPIVILSDLDGFTLNKIGSISNILFSKNIFIEKNHSDSLKKIDNLNIEPFQESDYRSKFLDLIEIEPPKDYLSHHDISNEWAIYRWAEFLKIDDSKAIDINREKIASMLYFKYLLAKNPIPKKSGISFAPQAPREGGKILYIDDEWAKGWSDILKRYFSKGQNIEFETFEYNFKDNNKFNTILAIKKYCETYYPDILLLDLRLTGIKITKMIKDINPAIQIIMLTATSQSIILENLYQHGILGYIKKEHPTNINISTKDNFNKLKALVDRGFNKSYLKEIWKIEKDILALKIFQKDKFRQMRFEINSIFEVLDSDMNKRYIYAMLSIHQSLEEINNHFIDDRSGVWYDSKKAIDGKTTTKNKILEILHKKLNLYNFDNKIQEITHLRNGVIHPNNRTVSIDSSQIVAWFKMLQTILKKVSSDKPKH